MKRVKFIFVIVFISIFSCSEDDDYQDYETRIEYFKNIRPLEELNDSILKVYTWNIQLGFGGIESPWSESLGGSSAHIDSIVKILSLDDPDIIMLSEVPLDRENTIIKRVLDSIGIRLNYNYAFGAHGFNSNGAYPTRAQWGNAVLSKYPIETIENREILNLNDKWTRRSVLLARLKLNSNLLVDCYSLHFEASQVDPCDSMGQILGTMEFLEESSLPQIIAGDFNCDGYYMDYYFPYIPSLVYHDSLVWGTNDRIYFSNHFESQHFYRDQESRNFSDHFLSVAELRIK